MLEHRDALPNFQDISTDQYQITDDDRWKTFFFYGYGFVAGNNIDRCPETNRLLQRIPGHDDGDVLDLRPAEADPGARRPVQGRAALPPGADGPGAAPTVCGIRVGNDVRHWTEGKSLVFDDVYEHEAWNDTDGTRVVLFVDFKRPLAGFPRNRSTT